MRGRGWAWMLVALAGLVAGCGARNEAPAGAGATGVEVREAWSRPSAAGVTVGAAYLTMRSAAGDRLLEVRVSPSVAARAEMHQVLEDPGGAMRMQQVQAIELPAGRTVELRPGSHHLMLIDLSRPLVEGDLFDLTLRFEKAGERTVPVPVRRR